MKFGVSSSLALVALLDCALGFPSLGLEGLSEAKANGDALNLRQVAGVPHGFNAKQQYVSTSGTHKFIAPGPGDQRGPCPGLNAMANHNYIPRNGIATISQFIQGTFETFGMGEDLGGFLAVYGAVMDGDLTAWSIGGPSAALPVVSGLLGTPQGMSGSHNKYENDASPMRGDLYLFDNSYVTQVPYFEEFYNRQAGVPDAQVNYGLDLITAHRASRFDNSIKTNPYFFNGPFSGVAASPAAYSFIFRFMGNKSAEYPEGRLDRNVLKQFYAITGEPGSFKYKAGWERFPDNWYKRAIGDEYTIPFLAEDAFNQDLKHTEFLAVGGNLGKTNSFTGIDPANISSVTNLAQLLSNKHAAMCFGFELGLQAAPDLLEGIFTNVTPGMNVLGPAFQKAAASLACPQIEKKQYNQFAQYRKYPGFAKSYKGYKGL